MSSRKNALLGELIENHDNRRIPLSASQRSNLEKIYPYYGAQGIIDHVDRFIFDGEYILVAEDGENLKSQKQKVCQVVTGKFWVNNHAHIIRASGDNDTRYLAYLLNLIDFKPYITGSAQPKLTKENLSLIKLTVHPPDEQRKIAAFLSSLDAKIALNHRINSELEGMAKLLYDYWFVQYDFPLSAAQATALGKPRLTGKPYRTSGGPMVYHEQLKREIPKGWDVVSLSQIAKTGSGGTPASKNREYYDGGDITWINSGELNSPHILSGSNFITQAGLDNSSAKLFPARTLLIALYGATAGKVSLLLTEACLNQAVCGIVPHDPKFLFYLKFLLSDLYSHLVMMSTGSARDNLSQDLVRNIKVVVPPPEILKQFDEFVGAGVATITNNIKQNQELTTLRDWLLPMLMNGQVCVTG